MAILAQNFSRACDTYAGNIIVQRKMAQELLNMLPGTSYARILEIGCGCGELTAWVLRKLKFSCMTCNDLSSGMLEKCRLGFGADPRLRFALGDARELDFAPKSLDLIVSNACFQWFPSLTEAVSYFGTWLREDGILLFSTFGPENFKEIKELCGVGLDYLSLESINLSLNEAGFKAWLKRERVVTYFNSAGELFSHLKKTGVTGLSGRHWTKGELKRLFSDYERRFSSGGKVRLTWDTVYALCRLKDSNVDLR